MKGRYQKVTHNKTDRYFDRPALYRRIEEAKRFLPADQVQLLNSVPKRGTRGWEMREEVRQRLGCKCLSFGAVARP
jgi:hypothetical protein